MQTGAVCAICRLIQLVGGRSAYGEFVVSNTAGCSADDLHHFTYKKQKKCHSSLPGRYDTLIIDYIYLDISARCNHIPHRTVM